MQQLNLEGISASYALLYPISTGKKRRASKRVLEIMNSLWWFCYSTNIPTQCEINVGTTGNLFLISFTIDYSNGCNYPNCEQKFIQAVEYQIAIVSTNIILTLTFTNGTTMTIVVNFCLINQTRFINYLRDLRSILMWKVLYVDSMSFMGFSNIDCKHAFNYSQYLNKTTINIFICNCLDSIC